MKKLLKIGVVIPTYRASRHVLDVVARIGSEVDRIYVVDDCCPDRSGALVESSCADSRVRVLYHQVNQGVGGAVISGYRAALIDGMDVIVKIDSDGQMDPSRLLEVVGPILRGDADYTKGNRFFDLDGLWSMPRARLFGNAILSFLTKMSSGYWNIFDPTNGYTAIHSTALTHIPLNKLSKRYFFETDMLFRLNTIKAVVVDVPLPANYGDEVSNLRISKIVGEFLYKHLKNYSKRIFYNYYLRDMSVASLELPTGLLLVIAGSFFGLYSWSQYASAGLAASAGTVMLSAMPILVGVQLLLAFLNYDITTVPRRPIHILRAPREIMPQVIQRMGAEQSRPRL